MARWEPRLLKQVHALHERPARPSRASPAEFHPNIFSQSPVAASACCSTCPAPAPHRELRRSTVAAASCILKISSRSAAMPCSISARTSNAQFCARCQVQNHVNHVHMSFQGPRHLARSRSQHLTEKAPTTTTDSLIKMTRDGMTWRDMATVKHEKSVIIIHIIHISFI